MLVLIGATPEGKKEPVGFQTGMRKSAQSWRELLVDIKQRGLEIAPDIAVGDGALGFCRETISKRRPSSTWPASRHASRARNQFAVPLKGSEACSRAFNIVMAGSCHAHRVQFWNYLFLSGDVRLGRDDVSIGLNEELALAVSVHCTAP
jgi:transposase-like protein